MTLLLCLLLVGRKKPSSPYSVYVPLLSAVCLLWSGLDFGSVSLAAAAKVRAREHKFYIHAITTSLTLCLDIDKEISISLPMYALPHRARKIRQWRKRSQEEIRQEQQKAYTELLEIRRGGY